MHDDIRSNVEPVHRYRFLVLLFDNGVTGQLRILEPIAQLSQQLALEPALGVEEAWLSNIL
ncbi:MAG: hypothetical protein ACLQEI_10790 [Terriglobales bacterium]